jgi:hydroxyquinol 1,2-dioxygenase
MNQERLAAVMPRAVEALHAFARDTELTNEELMTGLGFLKEVAEAGELVLLADVLGLSRLVDDQTHAHAGGTPSNVLGPFYVGEAPLLDNPGTIVPADSTAERIELWGAVTDAATGAPLPGAMVEVWQTDESGHYSNEYPEGDEWALRGRQQSAADGTYRIESVRPKHYTVKHDGPVGRLLAALGRHPWRPAHVHFMVSAPGHERLVTQVYIAGGPYLEDDAINGVKPELVRPIIDGRLRFDIALAPA